MSDPVIICLINSVTTLLIVAVSRWLSRREHVRTSSKVDKILIAVNGSNGSKMEMED